MEKLSTVLKDTLHTAGTTDIVPVEQKYLLTSEDLKTITATANALVVQKMITEDDLLASLKSLLNLKENPKLTKRIAYPSDGYGARFYPDKVYFEKMTEEQKEKGLAFVSLMRRPMTVSGINKLYTRLRLATRHTKDEDEFDEKLRMAIYVDEMRKHPAHIVRSVMMQPYEFFPTLNELICDCEREEYILTITENALKKGV